MKEVLKANIEQQDILSKIMEAYDKQRLASIDKYFGMAFFYFDILIWLTLYMSTYLQFIGNWSKV